MLTCKQNKCEGPALFRYTWPGKDESFVCLEHAPQLRGLANTMGFHLQLVPLTVDDHVRELKKLQEPEPQP